MIRVLLWPSYIRYHTHSLTSALFDGQWTDKASYKETLLKLAGLFRKNFEVFANYKIGKDSKLTEEILAAGPNF